MEILTPETDSKKAPSTFEVGQEVEVRIRGNVIHTGWNGITISVPDPNFPNHGQQYSFPASLKGAKITRVYPIVRAGEVWRVKGSLDYFVQVSTDRIPSFIPCDLAFTGNHNYSATAFFDTFKNARKIFDPYIVAN